MKQRIITALGGVPLIFLATWFGDPWFIFLIALVASLGALEFYQMAERSGARPLALFGVTWILLFLFSAHLRRIYHLFLLDTAIVFSLMGILLRRHKAKSFTDWIWTLGGILYMGLMLGYYVELRELPAGREWVLLALFSTFTCDIFAFLVGRAWGKHTLSPGVSPRKTWEGALAGFLATQGAVWLLNSLLKLSLNSLQIITLGSLLGILSQAGDLAESLLKRTAGVKDSGSLLPGHGGILDRIDSLIFSGIVVYYYVIYAIIPWK